MQYRHFMFENNVIRHKKRPSVAIQQPAVFHLYSLLFNLDSLLYTLFILIPTLYLDIINTHTAKCSDKCRSQTSIGK